VDLGGHTLASIGDVDELPHGGGEQGKDDGPVAAVKTLWW